VKRSFAISSALHLALLSILLATSSSSIRLSSSQVITVDLVEAQRQVKAATPPRIEPEPKQKPAKAQMQYKAKKKRKKPSSKPKEKPRKSKQPAKQASRSQTAKASKSGVRVDEADFKFAYYLEIIKERISDNWTPPPVGMGTTLTTIYFKIDRSGSISDIKIEKSSGSDIFDKSALRAVSEATPLPPLPAGFRGKWLGVHFEFEHRSS